MLNKLALVLAGLAMSACAVHHAPLVLGGGLEVESTLVLNNHTLRIHLADTRARPLAEQRPLLIYATGDRGWAGKDYDVYRHLVAWNFPVAGFDAHDYVKHLGAAETTTPDRLAGDFEQIVNAARLHLHLDASYPVVLVGVSRGADLAVVAAGQRWLQPGLTGVVAVALTREEEYVKWLPRRVRSELHGSAAAAAPTEPTEPVMVDLYSYLPRLGPLAVTVIQSTHDKYLPAAKAQVLFGQNTEHRHFVAIEAGNHSFGGAREALYDAMHEALTRMSTAMRP